MTIAVQCNQCGGSCHVDSEMANKPIRCQRCGSIFYAPQEATASFHNGGGYGAVQQAGAVAVVDRWYLRGEDNKVYGPIDRGRLDTWMAEGRITSNSQVLREGEAQWQWASDLYPTLRNSVASVHTGGPVFTHHSWTQPHRGALILVFGLLGLTGGCVIFSLIAWLMGHADLQAMRRGTMDPSGQGLTQAGMILGMVVSLLNLFVFAIFGLFLLIPLFLAMIAAAAGA